MKDQTVTKQQLMNEIEEMHARLAEAEALQAGHTDPTSSGAAMTVTGKKGRGAERAIQESEEKFRLLFEKSTDAALLLDDGKFIDCNTAALRLMRCENKEQLIGLRPGDVSPERQPDGKLSFDKAQEVIETATREGVNRFEWLHRAFDGSDVWVDVSLTVIPFGGRQIQYNVWRDISKRKLAEAAVKESLELFRTTLASIGDAVIVTDMEGRITFLNAEAERLTGWDSEEALEQPLDSVLRLVDEQNGKPVENPVDRVLRQGNVLGTAGATLLISRNGRAIPVHESGEPLRRTDGTVQGVVLAFRDFTVHKEAERTIQESEEKFRLLFEKSTDAALLLDSDRTFIDCNEAAMKIMACSDKHQLIGLRPADISPERQPDGMLSIDYAQEVIDASSREGVHRFEWLHRAFDGSDIWVDVSLTVIPFQGRRIFYNVWRDISKQKFAEAALKESREKYRCIYENVAEGMFRTDIEGRLISGNVALARMYGFDRPEDLIEGSWNLDSVHLVPKDRKLLRKLLQEKGVARNLETELYTKDGTTRWARMSVRVEKDQKGNILYYEGTLEDTSEKKWAEDKYRNIFLNATEGIFQITPEGRCFSANPALARICGFNTPEELMENAADIGTQLHIEEEIWQEYLKAMGENGYVRDHVWKVHRKDESIAWLSINARAVRDETGQVRYHEGTAQDITEKKLMLDQILMQRDLAVRLAQTGDVGKGLALILETALKASGMECGGIWLKRATGEEFELISAMGFSPKVERKISLVPVGSRPWKRIMAGERVLTAPSSESMPTAHKEGYKYAVILPILHDGRVMGSLNLLSRVKETISEQALIGLEFLDRQLGSIIVRIRVQQELEQEVVTRVEAEQALETERRDLEEANIALKVLLRQREKDKEEMEQRLQLNVTELVFPYVEKLKKSRLEGLQRTTLGFVETNLKEILSPFLHNVRNFKLTPRQLEIVTLIKEGRTTKEIAEFLNTSKDAIDKQRFIIRKKLGANKDKINLRSLLLSL